MRVHDEVSVLIRSRLSHPGSHAVKCRLANQSIRPGYRYALAIETLATRHFSGGPVSPIVASDATRWGVANGNRETSNDTDVFSEHCSAKGTARRHAHRCCLSTGPGGGAGRILPC